MDAELIKRLKGWFYLRLPAEDWTQFGSSAPEVLRTFDDDPDQENALLSFAVVVIALESQQLTENWSLNDHVTKSLVTKIMEQRMGELARLGIDMQQLKRVSDRMFKM
jgi:hypothetical protein